MLVKTAITAENASALYGLMPTRPAISNCLSMNPMRPNTHDMRRVRLMRTAKQALDYAEGKNGY